MTPAQLTSSVKLKRTHSNFTHHVNNSCTAKIRIPTTDTLIFLLPPSTNHPPPPPPLFSSTNYRHHSPRNRKQDTSVYQCQRSHHDRLPGSSTDCPQTSIPCIAIPATGILGNRKRTRSVGINGWADLHMQW